MGAVAGRPSGIRPSAAGGLTVGALLLLIRLGVYAVQAPFHPGAAKVALALLALVTALMLSAAVTDATRWFWAPPTAALAILALWMLALVGSYREEPLADVHTGSCAVAAAFAALAVALLARTIVRPRAAAGWRYAAYVATMVAVVATWTAAELSDVFYER